MVTLLIKLFIKDYSNTKDKNVRNKYGVLSSIVGICLNICLFAIKYIAGALSSSIAVMADAFNNLSDAGSSVITLVGFKFAGKKPDSDHPFGHGRIEYISGLVVSEIIILMGFELLKTSVNKIIHPQNVSADILTVVILIISICVKAYMYCYNKGLGKRIDSPAMKATAMDSLSDSVATTVVLVTTIISIFTGINLDGIGGTAVALFILWAGIGALKDTVSPLLGQAPEEEFVKEIEQIVCSHKEIMGIHDLIVHDYGPGRVFISLHGEVDYQSDICMLHDVIDNVELELAQKLDCEAVIHMDPVAYNNEKVRTLKNEITEIVKSIDETMTIHDFRIVDGNTHTNIIFDLVMAYECKMTEKEAVSLISEKIRQKWNNYYPVIKVDRKYT